MKPKPNYYEILGLQQDKPALSPDAVKKAYKKALLSHHPDKASKTDLNVPTGASTVAIDEIVLAYKTLSEPSLKAEYDRWLAYNRSSDGSEEGAESRTHHTGLETVDLDDLAFDEKTQSWAKSCRCGVGGYVVSEDELEKNVEDGELILGCKGCSLCLRVLFSFEN